MHHRLLKRLRWAYLVTDDLGTRALAHQNLQLLGKALAHTRDDKVLYEHWHQWMVPESLGIALDLEERLWLRIGDGLHDLDGQGYHPEAFRDETRPLVDLARVLQELIQAELRLLSHPESTTEQRVIADLRLRVAHELP